MRRLIGTWRRHKVLVTALAMALALTLFFAVRLVVFTIYWSDPAHRDQAPEGWMTPGYVQNSWNISPEALRAAIGPAARPGERQTLDQIARRQDEPVEAVIRRIEAAVAAERAAEQ